MFEFGLCSVRLLKALVGWSVIWILQRQIKLKGYHISKSYIYLAYRIDYITFSHLADNFIQSD